MMIDRLFERFVEASPLSIMVRALMERVFAAEALDELFERTAEKQYTRELLCSTVVSLMSLVVSQIHPSVNAADKKILNGRYWARTSDILLVRQALYQLS